jgi:hypothetical protein
MTDPVTLHNLYYLIDTRAWLDQRTGAHQPAPSSQLQDFVRCDVFDDYQPSMDVAARMRLWCAAHGYPVGDAAVIEAVAELPPIIVSDLFGIAASTAHKWAQLAQDSWTDYLAASRGNE